MLPTKIQFIWLRGFQRRRLKCEKLTNDRRRTTSDDKSSHGLWQGELKMSIISFVSQAASTYREPNCRQNNHDFGIYGESFSPYCHVAAVKILAHFDL